LRKLPKLAAKVECELASRFLRASALRLVAELQAAGAGQVAR
jgi:hypothetical protein